MFIPPQNALDWAFLLFSLASVAFWVWALIDCATNEDDTHNTKAIWIALIAVTNLLGALLYILVRRPQRKRTIGR